VLTRTSSITLSLHVFETLAHEAGHICLGHCTDQPSVCDTDPEVSRNQEREADSFAQSVLRSFYSLDENAKKPLYVAYLKNELVWAMLDRLQRRGMASDHPLAEERLMNALKSNSEIAAELGITEKLVQDILNSF